MAGWAIYSSYTLISPYWQVELFIFPIPWLVHIGRLNYLSFLYLDLCYIGRLSYLSFLFLDLCHIGKLSYLSFLFLDLCIIVMLSYLSFLFLDLCHIGRLSYLSFLYLDLCHIDRLNYLSFHTLICASLAGWAILPIPWSMPYWQVKLFILPIPWSVPYWQVELLSFLYFDLCHIGRLSYSSYTLICAILAGWAICQGSAPNPAPDPNVAEKG